MAMEINGYHGTRESDCVVVCSSQYFNQSHGEDEWLGFGVYFFERSHFYAKWWAKEHRRYNPFGILKAKITVDEQQVLDLSDPENLDQLDYYAQILINNRNRSRSFASHEINDKIVINYICNNVNPYDMVVGVFDHNKHMRRNRNPLCYRSRLMAHQIQLCVRSLNCISNIEQISQD